MHYKKSLVVSVLSSVIGEYFAEDNIAYYLWVVALYPLSSKSIGRYFIYIMLLADGKNN